MWTSEDTANMDRASVEAIDEFENLLKIKGGAVSAEDLVLWYKKWFMKAGHKRLGRYLVTLAKKVGVG